MAIPALSRRASVRLPSSRFQPLLSEPGVPISGTGLCSGIMRLVHGPPGRFGHAGGRMSPTSTAAAARPPLCIPSRVRRASEPVHASATSNLSGSTPSLMHVMFPESLPLTRGPGIANPAGLLPSSIPPHLRPLSSIGITRRLQSYGPLRHPGGPACPSRGSGWCVHTTDRASRVATSSLFHTCRRHYPGGNGPVRLSLLFPAVVGLPLFSAGSASALLFSRPAQRSLSLRPAWSLNRPRRPFDARVLRPASLPP